jgi:hypothetical protein
MTGSGTTEPEFILTPLKKRFLVVLGFIALGGIVAFTGIATGNFPLKVVGFIMIFSGIPLERVYVRSKPNRM